MLTYHIKQIKHDHLLALEHGDLLIILWHLMAIYSGILNIADNEW
jgi:hypothetical protein